MGRWCRGAAPSCRPRFNARGLGASKVCFRAGESVLLAIGRASGRPAVVLARVVEEDRDGVGQVVSPGEAEIQPFAERGHADTGHVNAFGDARGAFGRAIDRDVDAGFRELGGGDAEPRGPGIGAARRRATPGLVPAHAAATEADLGARGDLFAIGRGARDAKEPVAVRGNAAIARSRTHVRPDEQPRALFGAPAHAVPPQQAAGQAPGALVAALATALGRADGVALGGAAAVGEALTMGGASSSVDAWRSSSSATPTIPAVPRAIAGSFHASERGFTGARRTV